mmetsp:Transcript_127625/g.355204  ORF Transcript_127625/g.355204 Transcript_127625/m.355204 type:complete len:202 (+) Transcript_127625:676-1281(+)
MQTQCPRKPNQRSTASNPRSSKPPPHAKCPASIRGGVCTSCIVSRTPRPVQPLPANRPFASVRLLRRSRPPSLAPPHAEAAGAHAAAGRRTARPCRGRPRGHCSPSPPARAANGPRALRRTAQALAPLSQVDRSQGTAMAPVPSPTPTASGGQPRRWRGRRQPGAHLHQCRWLPLQGVCRWHYQHALKAPPWAAMVWHGAL